MTTWHFDTLAFVLAVVAAGLYVAGIVTLHRRGERWKIWPTIAFFVLGLGSFIFIEFGFLGTWSVDIRWAFSTRMALLLFAVPGLTLLGRPVALARKVLAGNASLTLERVLHSRPVRIFGNPVVSPLFSLAIFLVLLTPLAATLRLSPVSEGLLTVLVPIAGLLMILPLVIEGESRVGTIVGIELMFAFIELLMDAIPGLLLRLNGTVLDHAPAVLGALPGWFPNPLHDQHLSGDFLWFIAEVADVPVLAIFMIRWMRSDRKEARNLDELTDEEMDALTRAHLRGSRGADA